VLRLPAVDVIDARNAGVLIPLRIGAGRRLRLTVDLARVGEVKPAGLAQLMGLRDRLRSVGGDLCIAGLSRRTRAWYGIYGLDQRLPLADGERIVA
jgi:anti-anti-sigma regulatory factor